VSIFGWIAGGAEPPERWDLRRSGWTLRGEGGGRQVLLADVRAPVPPERARLAGIRTILLGVEEGAERALLLARGCAEVLPAATGLAELDARARRVAATMPRWRGLGPLTLDLFHRDARHARRWLGLHPREFGLLWRLADRPGLPVTRAALLRDVWRIAQEPETNSVEVHVSRLRAKLALSGCGTRVETVPEGGYRVACAPEVTWPDRSPEFAAEADQNAWTACPSRSRSR
jgi:DNA-binding winged helix-turn-helix (wHTH) protein